MDINEYRKINESFRRRLVYHVGKDCGFFVELKGLSAGQILLGAGATARTVSTGTTKENEEKTNKLLAF